MKKLMMLVLVMISSITLLYAQAFQKGTNIIGAGIGLGSSLGYFTYGTEGPGVSLQYERGIWDVGGPGVISLGGYVGHTHFGYVEPYYSERWNYTMIGIRSAYHFNGIHNNKFDIYGGVMLSYDILNWSYTGDFDYADVAYGNTTSFTLFIGGRYFFVPNFGVYAELGYGVSFLSIGLAYKF